MPPDRAGSPGSPAAPRNRLWSRLPAFEGRKRLHLTLRVLANRVGRHTKIQVLFVDDSEEGSVQIEARAAKHCLGFEAVELTQLIAHERAETLRENAGTSIARFGRAISRTIYDNAPRMRLVRYREAARHATKNASTNRAWHDRRGPASGRPSFGRRNLAQRSEATASGAVPAECRALRVRDCHEDRGADRCSDQRLQLAERGYASGSPSNVFGPVKAANARVLQCRRLRHGNPSSTQTRAP